MLSKKLLHCDDVISLPLLGSQLEVWLAEQVSAYYNNFTVAQYIDIKGEIDVVKLQRAIQMGLTEVDTIHSAYQQNDTGVVQVLLTDVSVADIHSPRAMSASFKQALSMMNEDIAKPLMASDEGPLYQHWLIKVGENRWLWYQRYHHIAVDQCNLAVINRRIAEIYTALVREKQVPACPFVSIEDIVNEYRLYVHSETCQLSKQFWLDYVNQLVAPNSLSSVPLVSQLLPQYSGLKFNQLKAMPEPLRQKIELEACVVESLKALATDNNITIYDLISAVLVGYIAKIAAPQGKVVVGYRVSRGAGCDSQLAAVAVPALTTLPLQITIDGDDTLLSLANKIACEANYIKPHQAFGGEHIYHDRDFANKGPFYGPTICCKRYNHQFDFAGIAADTEYLATGPIADIDFTLDIEGKITIEMAANANRYCRQSLILHGHRLHFLFAQCYDNPSLGVNDWRLLSVQELAELNEYSQNQGVENPQAYVLNKQLQLVPVGVEGDLYLAADNTVGDSVNDISQLVANPFADGGVMYVTKELARWDFNGDLVSVNDEKVLAVG